MTVYRKNPQIGLWLDTQELIVDNFAGGGGASTGIEAAIGRPVDIAINHDDIALSIHKVNHPHTRHYCESVFDINPKEVTKSMPVGLAWFSPDCRHFSVAKGSKPVDKNIRGLAWVAIKWAVRVKPRIIMIENVKEFMSWGPLKAYKTTNEEGELVTKWKPDPLRKGETFNGFIKKLCRAGYKVEHRVLRACDFGAPTSRQRFFLVARRDNQPVVWPKPTHGKGLIKYRTAAECIDWSVPCPSIFERKKPLAVNTCKRIAKGLQKFVIDNADPFLIEIAHYSKNGKNQRAHSLCDPLRTITAYPKGGSFALVAPIIDRQFGNGSAHSVKVPVKTITAGGAGGKNSLVTAFLVKYYGTSSAVSLDKPIDTITTKDRLGLVTINRVDYKIIDIGMRMLTPDELYKAQGFPSDYIFKNDANGNKITKTKQVALCGNSVPPTMAEVLVKANMQ